MRKSQSASSATVVIVTSIFATTLASAADTFRKLNDSEIRSKVSGMEIVDVEDHWAEQYIRDGSPCPGLFKLRGQRLVCGRSVCHPFRDVAPQ